jgi:hypothetical protein
MRVRASAGSYSFRRRATLEECYAEAEAQVKALQAELEEADSAASNRRQEVARQSAVREEAARLPHGDREWARMRRRSFIESVRLLTRSGRSMPHSLKQLHAQNTPTREMRRNCLRQFLHKLSAWDTRGWTLSVLATSPDSHALSICWDAERPERCVPTQSAGTRGGQVTQSFFRTPWPWPESAPASGRASCGRCVRAAARR